MGKAARIGDMHWCPQQNADGTPYRGGAIQVLNNQSVHIGGLPAATVGDLVLCHGSPATIVAGSSTVFINGKPAAREGDPTSHGGTIIKGCDTVTIG